jgi:hypothetical protein
MGATISHASFANLWSKATRGPMRVCGTIWSACCQMGGKRRLLPRSRLQLFRTHDKRLTCFSAVPNDEASRNRRPWSSFVRSTQKSIEPMTWFSNVLGCCVHVPERTSTAGSTKETRVGYPNFSPLPQESRKTKMPSGRVSPGGSIMAWLREA